MSETTKNTNYFPELTGVRAIAAAMVFIHHFNPFGADMFGAAIYGMAKEMHTGVTLFFVLSGFLIAYRYSELKNFDFRRYFFFRVARIYPMYLLLTTATFLLPFIMAGFHIRSYDVFVYLTNITFLRGFSEDLKFTLVSQGWSLTVEETFYILAPLFFFMINKRRFYLFVFPILLFLGGFALHIFFTRFPVYGLFRTMNFTMIYTFFGRSAEFFIGIGLALIVKKRIGVVPRPKVAYATYVGVIGVLLCLYGFHLLNEGPDDYGTRTVTGKILNNVIMPIVGIAPLYYGLIMEDSWLAKIMRSKLFVLLGKSSYVFYLIHMGIIQAALPHLSSNPIVNIITDFLFLQIISIMLFSFIEEPLNNLIRKKVTAATDPKGKIPNSKFQIPNS